MLSVLYNRDHARKVVLVHEIVVIGVIFLMYIFLFISSFWIVTTHTELLCALKLVKRYVKIDLSISVYTSFVLDSNACQICELKRRLPFSSLLQKMELRGFHDMSRMEVVSTDGVHNSAVLPQRRLNKLLVSSACNLRYFLKRTYVTVSGY